MELTPPKAPDNLSDADAALRPVVVGHCSTLNEAQMVVSLLASFGIEAAIDSENYYRMLGSMVPGLSGIRVRVRQLDAEAALEILEENPGVEQQDDDNSDR